MNKSVLLILSLLFFGLIASAQSNNVKIRQYAKADFNADTQFWAACEDTNGVVFFGNNDGVVIFDGEHWQKIALPNNSSVRSLARGTNGTIYAGGYNEAGSVQKDRNGNYYYTSMINDLRLEGRNIENIWDIQAYRDKLLMRAYNEIIVTSGKTATHIPASASFTYSALVGNDYLVQEAGHGILKLDSAGRELLPVFTPLQYNSEDVAALLPGDLPGTVAMVTVQGSVYHGTIATGTLQRVANVFDGAPRDQASGAIQDGRGNLYIATLSSKIIMVTHGGTVLQNPAMFRTLQESPIHGLYRANDNNIWVLQNNGLAYIDFKSPYTSLFGKASVYDALVHNGMLYLATTQGVYYAPFNEASPASPAGLNLGDTADRRRHPGIPRQRPVYFKERYCHTHRHR